MSQSNMDPFDEFEFKPLTDGLGFHKKTVNLKDGLRRSGVIEDELQTIPDSVPQGLIEETPAPSGKKHTFEDVLSALEKTPLPRASPELSFTETFAREPMSSPFPAIEAFRSPNVPSLPSAPTVPGSLPSTMRSNAMTKTAAQNATGTRRGAGDSPTRKALQGATVSLPSAFLDLIIVLAIALLFLAALLTVTKVDLAVVTRNLNDDFMTQLSLGLTFLAVMQMYVVISRSFFGRTLGEWTFDMQIGQDQEQKSESYPLRVALRSFLTTATGLIALPMISVLLKRDIAGSISGVKLYRQQV